MPNIEEKYLVILAKIHAVLMYHRNPILATAPTPAAFQVFQAVTVLATLDRSTALASIMVSGGVLLRTVQPMPGSAAWFTTMAV
jgi:hypothetical protein